MIEINEDKNISILVVEDESIVAEDIKDSLEVLGYNIKGIADSGKEAIEKARETKPNLVLMDIRLKGEMDGVQAAEQIWQNLKIPVVFLTANSDKITLQRAKATDPFGYITKPFKEKELHTGVEIALHRYELERKLKDREKWLETILTSIGDAVIATDKNNCITLFNPTAELLTGWKQEEALGKDSAEVFNIVNHETAIKVENPLTAAIEKNEVISISERTILIKKDGTELPIDDSAAPITDNQEAIIGAVLVFRDISDRHDAEKSRQLVIQMAELERVNLLKDDFLSTVSHELRTPMTNIKMAVKMLQVALERINSSDSLTTQPPPEINFASRYLQILNHECEREIELINNLLDLQRLEVGAQPIDVETVNLQTWLPELVEPFMGRTQERQQTLQVNIADNLPPLLTDQTSLRRILEELLNNACKYTPPGENIRLTARAENELMQLQVCNSGVEISATELPRIFDKFYRIPSGDRWKQGGTGLGLALVQKLTQYLGGYISVKSEHHITCFTVELSLDSQES